MLVSALGAKHPGPTFRKGSAGSAAMEKLVPGDYPQIENDLAAFSQPVLDLLSRYGTRVAVLADGQTLADSPALRTLDDAEVTSESVKTNLMVQEAVAKAFPDGVSSYDQLESAAEQLTRGLRLSNLDNHLGIALSPFSLDDLAAAREIPAENVDSWKNAFASLNQGLVETAPSGVQASYGLLVLPHTYHNGAAIPESRLSNARQVSAEFVEKSLGLNRSDEKLVLLHEKFLPSPAPELGNYRVGVHELGHALDHGLEDLLDFPGFGDTHRQTVDALFAADQAKVQAGAAVDSVFTSDRADDDVREYFAEAVEAYLTPANGNGHDNYRAGNCKEGLAEKNPSLFSYLEKVMTTDFPVTAVPREPKRSLLPPGIPDPDLEVVRVS